LVLFLESAAIRKLMTKKVGRKLFDEWSIYDQVLDHNYMFHDEIYRDVQRILADRYGSRPFTILDLGCGSARHLAQALEGRSVSRYVGYDLSEAALAHAARNLTGLGCEIELHQGDLLDGLKAGDERFNLIICSFALHHLMPADKAVFFRLACRTLEPDGILLLIDAMRNKEEEIQVYLNRYCDWLRSEWKALPAESLDLVSDHVRNNDVPETAADLNAMALSAGFGQSREINRFRWHQTWCFERESHERS
jgi:SAM-dependent methyltransferase